MKKVLIGFAVFFGIVILSGIIGISQIWSHRNVAVSLEEVVKAQQVANKSNYDSMWKSFKEMAQITDMQAADIKDVYTSIISGRYDQDQNVLFKMVQEQNPKLDTAVYTRLQDQVSANRKEFDNNQKAMADKIREYNTYIREHVVMNAIFHFETLDANKFVVTSESTEKAFETGKADEIQIKK